MKWILIQPEYKYNVAFPLSIATVATFLNKHTKEEAKCFDLNLQSLDSVLKYIKNDKFKPDIIGFSVTSVTKSETLKCCEKIKKDLPNVKIIIGGVVAKLEYNEFLNNRSVEFCCNIDIEQIGMGIKKPLKIIDLFTLPGISFKKEGKVIVNPSKSLEDINHFRFPDRELDFINYKKYLPPENLLKNHPITILTSRGCPYECTYCASSRICGKKTLMRSVKKVIEELDYLRKLGHNCFVFEDYEMLVDIERTKEICMDLKKKKSLWILKTRVEKINDEIAKMLAESGCLVVYLGVETVTKEAIWGAKKYNITKESVTNAITHLKNNGIRVCASIQFGLPGDTEETFVKNTVLLLKKLLDSDKDMVQLHFTTLFPGTELYRLYKDKGVYVNIHKDLPDVVAHGLEGFVMPHLNEEVIKTMYHKVSGLLGDLLSKKAIWSQNN